MGEVAESKVDLLARFSFFSSTIRSSPVPIDDREERWGEEVAMEEGFCNEDDWSDNEKRVIRGIFISLRV